jgi:hypothetical protein
VFVFVAVVSEVSVTGDTFCSETDAIMENEPLDELLKQVDTLFTGSSEDKSLAYQILHERRNKVTFSPPVKFSNWKLGKTKFQIRVLVFVTFPPATSNSNYKSISCGPATFGNKSFPCHFPLPYTQICD